MTAASALIAGRRAAEARMTDTWTIGTNLGWSYNPTSGQDEQTVDPLFTTPARLAERGTQATESEAGGRTVLETRRELHIPWDSPAVPPNAVAECTATGPLTDPTLRRHHRPAARFGADVTDHRSPPRGRGGADVMPAEEIIALAADFHQAGRKVGSALYDVYKESGDAFAQDWASNATETAGEHGKHYPVQHHLRDGAVARHPRHDRPRVGCAPGFDGSRLRVRVDEPAAPPRRSARPPDR